MTDRLRKFIPFGQPHFGQSERRAVLATLDSKWVGAGPKTFAFERALARYVHSPQAVAVSSCTAALHLSLLAAGVGPGDEVITTPLTFVATVNAITMTGARVRFADVDPETYNISPIAVRRMLTRRTKAILPVHFGGLPADLDALAKLARHRSISIIEDAAHAPGARYHGRMIGAGQNSVCFSFYPNKNITSIEGGAITLRNKQQARDTQIMRMHGLDADAWKRFHRKSLKYTLAVMPGFKYNLTDLQAAIGTVQLQHVETWQRRREQYAAIYDRIFRSIPGVHLQWRPKNFARDRHALHLYTLRLDFRVFGRRRDAVVQTLLRKNIGAAIHYLPVHLHPWFRRQGFRRGDFPLAERIGDEILTLPLTPHLSFRDIKSIGDVTAAILHRYSNVGKTPSSSLAG